MHPATILPPLGILWLIAAVAPLAAHDGKDAIRDQYYQERRDLWRHYDRLDDAAQQAERLDERRLRAERRAALRCTHGRQRTDVLQFYRQQERLLDDAHQTHQKQIKGWYEQQKEMAQTQYRAARAAVSASSTARGPVLPGSMLVVPDPAISPLGPTLAPLPDATPPPTAPVPGNAPMLPRGMDF